MLHKRHNSVVTLAVLLALVGVSKPAKAFLLAQSDTAPATFTVPDKLSENTAVKIAASNSTDGINNSLKESFAAKYPQAEVDIETQDSGAALKSVSGGQADIAAIGRNLTAEEKAQGFTAVPISREKIAIVTSKENPYDGNLTIGQFAQIFRGEITDWAEIGGTPGRIELVDMPDSNDTRQAFPNYPVFQEAEFTTGNTATQLEQDSTEAMANKLGKNGISYAVANDVVNRDDVKIITMHTTQPNDSRYPFSQPFNLVYQGTPSEAAQAYLGFASAEGGQEIVANRTGSISTAAVTAIASAAASPTAINVNADTEAVTPKADKLVSADAGVNADGDLDGVAPTAVADSDLDPKTDGSGEINPDVDDSGSIDPNVAESGETNADLDGSGEVNVDLDGSGEIDPDLNESGELNPDVEGSGEPLLSDTEGVEGDTVVPADEVDGDTVVPNNTVDEEAAEKRGGKWWLLLIPLLAIPLLGALIFGGRKRSDREPAVDNVPNVNSPQGGVNVPGMSDGGDIPPVGANVSGNLGNVAGNTVNTPSSIGSAGLAAGGAALAGGAAAANLAGRNRRTENISDADLDLDLDDSVTANEIPSNPVTEFTDRETELQVEPQSELQMDRDIDLDRSESGFDGISSDRAAGFDRNLENGTSSGSVIAGSNLADAELDVDTGRSEFTAPDNKSGSNAEVGEEFLGDYVLPEETRDISVSNDLDVDTNVNGGRASGAALGGAAASGFLNRDRDAVTDIAADRGVDAPDLDRDNDLDLSSDLDDRNLSNDTSTDFPESISEANTLNLDTGIDTTGSSQDIDLDLDDEVTISELDLETGIDTDPDGGRVRDAALGGAALGGAAASGIFNRDRDAVADTAADRELDALDLDRDADLDLDLDDDISADFTGDVGQANTSDVESIEAIDNRQNTDLNLDDVMTSEIDLDLLTDIDTDIDSGRIINDATVVGGAPVDTGVNDLDLDRDTDLDLDLDDLDNDISADFTSDVSQVNTLDVESIEAIDNRRDTDLDLDDVTTSELDLDLPTDIDTDLDPNVDGGAGIIDGATAAGGAALGGAAASEFFDRNGERTSNIQEFETFETSFDVSTDNSSSFADNVIADAETTAIDDNDLQGMTLDSVAQSNDLTLDEIALDNEERTINASLEEIRFDDADSSGEINLDEIALDDPELNLDSSTNDVVQRDRVRDIRLEDLGFADAEPSQPTTELDLGESNATEITELDLGESNTTEITEFDLGESNTTEISNLSDDRSDDMNNISEWLDSLETPNQDSDNISDWLDTLDRDSSSSNTDLDNSNQETNTDLTEEADDISFQFLEDLLDRDTDSNRNNQ